MVEALRRTYAECCLRFDRAVGFDNQTFGQMAYKSSWFHLEQFFKSDAGVHVVRADGSFELDIEGVRVHPFKVGHMDGDIYDRFPSNEEVFAFMAEQNIVQMGLLPEAPASWFVLAHAGNPIDGLKAVYLAAPGGPQSWASVVRIDEPVVGRETLPEPVTVELPELQVIPDDYRARGERDG